MSVGAERTEMQPQGEAEWAGESWEAGAADEQPYFQSVEVEAPPRRSLWPRIWAGLLILLALGWLGAVGFVLSQSPPEPELSAWIGWIATASAPLILIGLGWLIFGRSSRRETERFTAAVTAMRQESQA